MRVLVTGGAGFIGSHLTDRLLALGHEVDVVDNFSTGTPGNLLGAQETAGARLRVHRMDIADADAVALVASRGAEVVFHLAAQADVRVSVARPVFDAQVNVVGSLNVYEGARQGGTRKIVLAGSGGTLYGVPTTIPTSEAHPQRPISPYGVAKKAAGDYLHCYGEVHGIDSTILALANVYGPRQDPYGEAGVVAIFGSMLIAGRRPTVYGDGEQTRDFVYVDDVADAFVRAIDGGSRMLLNVGTGVETTVNELFRQMADLTGFQGTPGSDVARPGELRRSALDSSALAEVMGWKPSVSLRDGLGRTLEWLRERAGNQSRSG